MAHQAPAAHFPKWRLWRRLVYATQARLASLPMVVLVPTIAALTGTVLAVSHPELTIRHGLVVHEQSFWHALWTGVAGGVGGLFALVGVVFAGSWVWYRFLGGDSTWESVLMGRADGQTRWRIQIKRDVVPVNPTHLGAIMVLVKTPSGRVVRSDMAPTVVVKPLGFWTWVRTGNDAGVYEARWYTAREGEKLRELARTKVRLGPFNPDEESQ